MKSYTNIPQSKKLSEILSLKSADMHYERVYFEGKQSDWFVKLGTPIKSDDIIPCWSLAALLSVLPYPVIEHNYNDKWVCRTTHKNTIYLWEDYSLINACYEMIEKLHTENLI